MGAFAVPAVIFGLVCAVTFTIGFSKENVFNVMSYGAVEGTTRDSSHAILKAWKAACSSKTESSTVLIPKRHTLLVKPIVLRGPCRANSITFMIHGEIVAPTSPGEWTRTDQSQWLAFEGVSRLNVTGTGIGKIDGRGTRWWSQSCRDHPDLKGCTSLAPTAMKIISCNNTSLSNIHFINSSQTHVLIMGSKRVEIKNLVITAPESSPNTDGIHIHSSHNVIIKNTTIGTGDDCVSIGDYTSNVNISHIRCGPGHGISIGSLGRSGNFVQVEDIRVSNVYFKGTTNGARIKTWQIGRGNIRRVTFQNLYFESVNNPFIIDQNYGNLGGLSNEKQTGVHIANVSINNLFGTSISNVAINLNCSRSVACTGILLKSIQLKSANSGQKVTSSCLNAHGFSFGVVQPEPCLQI
ncbi:probable polygalacturonase At1g80170 [Momordica charantia]|uniref:Probable polygalacturonase At1g80170 n=1 Tax=Momordica charantia TaxID=3673 RepID=A0A6J1CMV4_MOMCH|nr:probable polygalacturonase At1g80170 [Momordica charantia]